MARKSRGLKLKKKIYIYCEGKTEKIYFDILNKKYNETSRIQVKAKEVGETSHRLIDYAISDINNKSSKEKNKIGQVIIIFDKDEISDQEVEKLFQKADRHDIKIAFSNINFETWLLMHFEDVDFAYSKQDLNKKMKKYFNVDNYQEHKGNIKTLAKIEGFINRAMKNGLNFENYPSPQIHNNPYTNLRYIIHSIYNQKLY